MSASKTDSEFYWRVRVCPVPFEDFCQLQDNFRMLISASISLEFRMSSVLLTKMPKTWQRSPCDADLPWIPSNEKAFMKSRIAATLGMLEVIVSDSLLVPSVHCIRHADFSRKGRLRFELKRLTAEEAHVHGIKMAADMSFKDLYVMFSVRLQSVYPAAMKHPPGHHNTAEDNYIFVKKISDDVPDHVLQAILPMEMIERRTGADNTGTATFNVKSLLGAQVYMELYDGILINSSCLELSTTLGTLQDAKRIHADMQQVRAEANAIKVQAPSATNAGRGHAMKRTYEMSTSSAACGRARETLHPGAGGAFYKGAEGTFHREDRGTFHRRAGGRGHSGTRGIIHGGSADRGHAMKRTYEMSTSSAAGGRARGALHPGTGEAFYKGAEETFHREDRGTIHRRPGGRGHSGTRGIIHGGPRGASHGGGRGAFSRSSSGAVHSAMGGFARRAGHMGTRGTINRGSRGAVNRGSRGTINRGPRGTGSRRPRGARR